MHFQTLTSALQGNTIAVLMLCAITQKDLTTVIVIRDTTETGGIVKQVGKPSGLFLCLFDYERSETQLKCFER